MRTLFALIIFSIFCRSFYSLSNDSCSNLKFQASDPGFTSDSLNKMLSYFLENLNINNKGGVVASPDKTTPVGGGNYYYHWMRDGAISMQAFMEFHQFDPAAISDNMHSYVQWVLKVQNEKDPFGFDIRIEPKYNLPDGDVFLGGWGRPQTDGPGLRATTLIHYALTLLQNGQKDYVLQYLWTNDPNKFNGGAIKYDLDWVANNWDKVANSFDLWEDLQSEGFFWNKINFRKALVLGAELATKMGDTSLAQTYTSVSNNVASSIESHWNGEYFTQASNRLKDGAVICGLNKGYADDDFLKPIDDRIAKTVTVLNELFCETFSINQKDNDNNVPGIMYGRYQGDVYQNGNPWQLISANLATLFYRAASYIYEKKTSGSVEIVNDAQYNAWKIALNIKSSGNEGFLNDSGDRDQNLAQAFLQAGDAVMQRIYYHVQGDDFHVSEQIDKDSGYQISAKDLTWSYGDVIVSLLNRNKVVSLQKKYNNIIS